MKINFSFNRNSMNEFISLLSRILHYDFVNRIELEAAQVQSTPVSEKNVHQNLPQNSILKLVLDFQLLAQVFQSSATMYSNFLQSKIIVFLFTLLERSQRCRTAI